MVSCLILIQGKKLKEADLHISLQNALQLVMGNAPDFGIIVHVAADTADYLGKALIQFAKIPRVTGVVTLMIQNS
ncbi:MAG: hypothetical protein ABI416_19835 [Ginsengibacter sp.]